MSNTINTISALKAKWITNYIPTQSDFSDLFTTIVANTSGSGDVNITSSTGLVKVNGQTVITDNMTASLSVTSASYSLSSSYSNNSTSASYASTSSYAPLYLPLSGGTINGNVTVNGTASVSVLYTTYETSSIIYASGSTKFGDTSDDTHQFTGSVYVSGSTTTNDFIVSGSLFSPNWYQLTITGSNSGSLAITGMTNTGKAFAQIYSGDLTVFSVSSSTDLVSLTLGGTVTSTTFDIWAVKLS